jgi:hypothetical protein
MKVVVKKPRRVAARFANLILKRDRAAPTRSAASYHATRAGIRCNQRVLLVTRCRTFAPNGRITQPVPTQKDLRQNGLVPEGTCPGDGAQELSGASPGVGTQHQLNQLPRPQDG